MASSRVKQSVGTCPARSQTAGDAARRCVTRPARAAGCSVVWRRWPLVFASWPRSGYTLFVPEADDLFGAADPATPPAPDINRPLADRLRPATLSEVVGQD